MIHVSRRPNKNKEKSLAATRPRGTRTGLVVPVIVAVMNSNLSAKLASRILCSMDVRVGSALPHRAKSAGQIACRDALAGGTGDVGRGYGAFKAA
jgi:hypothetical protein